MLEWKTLGLVDTQHLKMEINM
uniref:Uncharacterized protein n=1 Tax=Rhizophora mucronata TaxID=61149 RepID=A0A2P2QI62_RHIMU